GAGRQVVGDPLLGHQATGAGEQRRPRCQGRVDEARPALRGGARRDANRVDGPDLWLGHLPTIGRVVLAGYRRTGVAETPARPFRRARCPTEAGRRSPGCREKGPAMPTTSLTTPAPATTRDLSLPTALGSALLAVGSLGYIAAGALTEGGPGRAGYLHPLNAPACTPAAVGATILALVLAAWRPSGLPRWATQLAAAGMVFTAAAAWVSGTVMVGLA